MALWKSDWLEADKEYKMCMLMTITRMRRPLLLTVGKFAPLTLNTFVAVCIKISSFSIFLTCNYNVKRLLQSNQNIVAKKVLAL